jgi:hypothetical protein
MSPADDKPKGALPLFAPAPWPGVLAATQTGVLDDALGMMPVRGACAKRRGCADRLPGLCPESMGVGSFGQVKFDDQRKALAQPLAVTPWCSADCKLGCVAVNLDFAQVFGCEVYASDAGFASFGPEYDEQKLNVGLRVCRSLFRCSCVLVLMAPLDFALCTLSSFPLSPRSALARACSSLHRCGVLAALAQCRVRCGSGRLQHGGWARERLAIAACSCCLLPCFSLLHSLCRAGG